MKIIYRAKDGKEFDDEGACKNYERSLHVHTFKMWNNRHKPLTKYNGDAYRKAVYVMVKDFDEINDIEEEFNHYGYSHSGICMPGFYCLRYDSRVIWENAKDIIKDYQKQIDDIKKMMESVDGLNERDIL